MDIITDQRISQLLREPKKLPADWKSRMVPSAHAHSESQSAKIDVAGESGSTFRLWCRRNPYNPLDFSIGLMVIGGPDGTNTLARYNGAHPSEHTNKVERDRGEVGCTFRNRFHVHRATQRYQEAGYDIVGYAEVSDRFNDFESALQAMLDENGFVSPDEKVGQLKLF